MYVDDPLVPNCPARKVIVIEKSDEPYSKQFSHEVIQKARASKATSSFKGKEFFWVIFATKDIRQLRDLTEEELHASLEPAE